ncbi:MAG: hypothetical protein GXZ06_02280 [Tissierellia bacterium]|nr:hypothetical protein [Tissierellia bacterium]
MLEETINILCKQYGVSEEVVKFVNSKEKLIQDKFKNIDQVAEYNHYKVIKSMQDVKLTSTDFNWTTGYGYGDIGRDKVEEIYSIIFNTEDALVRPLIASGTHAINLTLSGLLRPNDEFVSITGSPYDTLQEVIGIKGNQKGTLLDYGVKYKEVPLKENKIDINGVIESIGQDTKLLFIQRSTGYSDRRAIPIKEIEKAIKAIKDYKKDIIVMVDNCYGEFTDVVEPTDVGADIMAGSLIKNPGGGLAYAGGYVVGKKDLVEQVANRSTAPGIGKACGLTFGMTRSILQGLFLAPHIVAQALKGAILIGVVYKELGFDIVPDIDDVRSDIIQGIKLQTPERVVEFCKGIQKASAVDSYITPMPWNMPGYKDKVVMAAGGFVEGSSIELSADGPMREPYYVYFQGGLTYEHCKLGAMISVNNLYKNNLISKNKLTI